jgi:glycerol uptake facilitator-like aquaporin
VKRIVAEFLGTAFLLAAVVGSGIMAAKLAGGNGALALLCNTLPTGAILAVLILTFGPVSGAHFNPAVSTAMALRRKVPWRVAGLYILAQIVGGIVGVLAAHAMFELPLWQVSMNVRTGHGQWLAEFVATFGLLLTIFGCAARTPAAIPYAVGLHHGGLLVHRINVVRQSRRNYRPRSLRYLRGHRPGGRARIHYRSACRRALSHRACALAF